MSARLFALFCVALATASLGGCAGLAGKPRPAPAAGFEQRLYQLSVWKLEGRIGAKIGQEGWNANLVWEHGGGQDRLRIFGPFSQGTVSVVVQDDLIYINDGNNPPVQARDPDGWLRQRLGFAVPLRSLRYWVLGLPDPGFTYVARLDAAGGVAGFEQQGWTLAVERFESVGGLALPQKMSIRGGEATLKLVADEWVFNQ